MMSTELSVVTKTPLRTIRSGGTDEERGREGRIKSPRGRVICSWRKSEGGDRAYPP